MFRSPPEPPTRNAIVILCMVAVCLATSDAGADEDAASREASSQDRQQQIESLRTSDDSETAVKHLIAIDADLSPRANGDSLHLSVLTALAEHRTPAALEHLRSVFESQTLRRHDAAYAISLTALSRPTSDQDWRYLVRSLPIVEGEYAVSVLRALRRFQRRATKATWVREVILAGLRLPEEVQSVAVDLLEFWTGHAVSVGDGRKNSLTAYQDWFRQTYPTEPDPTLPVDPKNAKWTSEALMKIVASVPQDETILAAGALVYSKASCSKCHRHASIKEQSANDQLGPNLTSLGWRRQAKEILSAILYPSHRLNDEYPVTTVVLQSGKTVSGFLLPDTNDGLKVVAADLTETSFTKSEIEETISSKVSNMPSGLLDTLTAEEVSSLFAFLTIQSGEYDPHARPVTEQ